MGRGGETEKRSPEEQRELLAWPQDASKQLHQIHSFIRVFKCKLFWGQLGRIAANAGMIVVQGVEVEPNNPHLFWSAAEDGTVRQYDTRLPSGSQKAWDSPNCLLSVRAVGPASANHSLELKGISLNKV